MTRFLSALFCAAALPAWAQHTASDAAPASDAAAASAQIAYVCHTADGRTVQTAVPEGRCRPLAEADRQQLASAAVPSEKPADNTQAPHQAAGRPKAYICRTPDNKAVFTSEPLGNCEPSHMSGAQIDTPPAATADTDLAKVWAEAEAAAADDVQVLPPMQVILRNRQENPPPVRATLRQPARRPAPVYVPPRPPTRKELVERDIRREERALAREESQLAAARLSGNPARVRSLLQTVNDRRNGLNALRQEMRRFH